MSRASEARPVARARVAALAPRVMLDCHFAVQLSSFIPGFLSYPVAVFLKCQSDITLLAPRLEAGAVPRGLEGQQRRGGRGHAAEAVAGLADVRVARLGFVGSGGQGGQNDGKVGR